MAFADDLLRQAYQLANKESKKPTQASLRRAVSSGYYALFHLLVEDAVKKWELQHQRPALARTFEHRTMKSVCDEVIKSIYKAGSPPTDEKLKIVAKTFVYLQHNRHSADYDIGLEWRRADVLTLLDLVKKAFSDWRDIRDQRPAQDFLLQLLMPRIFKSRDRESPPAKP